MDKSTLSHYGWVVIVIIVITILIGFSASMGNFVSDSTMATLGTFNNLSDFSHAETNKPTDTPDTPVIDEVITNVSDEEIETNPLVYGIGATKREYVIATFNEGYTEVTITKNGEESDGLMVDWTNPTVPFEQPMFTHRKTLTKMTVEPGVYNMGNYCAINTPYLTDLTLPEGLLKVGNNSFWGSAIKSLTLPSTVKELGTNSFAECAGLTSFSLNDGLEIIGHNSFYLCKNIKQDIVIPNSVRFIGGFAFGSDSSTMGFTGLYLGNSVEFIGNGAFQICHNVANEVQLPDSLKVIGDFAFNHMMNVKTEVLRIPAGVIQIGGVKHDKNITLENYLDIVPFETGTHTFYDFGRFTFKAVDVDENNQYYKDIDGVLFSKDGTRLVCYPSNKPGREYEIPEGVTKIDELAFYSYTGVEKDYLKVITIPDSLDIELPVTGTNILNVCNTITNALYSYSGVEEIRVKPTNTKYMVEDGCLYSLDGTRCLYIPTYRNVVNIREGCTTIDAAYFPLGETLRAEKDINFTFNIPASVTSIPDYTLPQYPDESTLNYINRSVDTKAYNFVLNVDPANPVYTVDADGHIALK